MASKRTSKNRKPASRARTARDRRQDQTSTPDEPRARPAESTAASSAPRRKTPKASGAAPTTGSAAAAGRTKTKEAPKAPPSTPPKPGTRSASRPPAPTDEATRPAASKPDKAAAPPTATGRPDPKRKATASTKPASSPRATTTRSTTVPRVAPPAARERTAPAATAGEKSVPPTAERAATVRSSARDLPPSGPPAPIASGPKPVAAVRAFVSSEQATSEHEGKGPTPEAPEPGPSTPTDEPPPTAPAVAPEPAPEPQPEEHLHHGPLRADIPSMYVVQITPELAPVAKVGGLADVVFGLSRELQLRGHTVEVIVPKYDCLRYDHVWGLHVCFDDLWVPWWGGKVHCSVWYGEVHGRKCYFIEPHHQENYFNRGHFYGSNDDHLRFAFFSRAAMEFLYKSGKRPEVIHCHDWQTGLVPVFLYEIYQHLGMWHPRVVFTIHNFKHQGVTGEQLLWATELGRPEYYFHTDRLRDDHNPQAVNMMKAGIVYSNFVTTVSPNHAWEAKTGQGHGLEHALHVHEGKYGGVVNGVDYDVWNPEVDRYIPTRYGIYNIEDKYQNKRALRDRLWIADCAKPVVAYIGRLDDQKGLDLVRHALFYSLGNNAQFVLLGSAPDPRIGHDWWSLKQHLNDNQDCHIELGFNEELSHLIYAGADLVIVPSKYEPCGLTQLVGMRYGTVPVVRAVGGLADTVFDKDYDWRPLHERNGYVFQHYTHHALEVTLHRAFGCYWDYPEHFRHLMLNGMRYDYSWNIPGQHYLNIYDHVRDK